MTANGSATVEAEAAASPRTGEKPAAGDGVPPLVRAFIREEYAEIDPKLPGILQELRRVGATECW
jgi:hypothetical protein